MLKLRALVLALLLCGAALPVATQPAAADDTLSECQCLDCLKLWRLAARAELQAHNDGWQRARRALQTSIDYYNSHPDYQQEMAQKGRILFCDLWGTFEDEMNLLRESDLPKLQRQIFANAKHCLGPPSGATDPVTCEIDNLAMMVGEMRAPCPQIHLAILAHELVHQRDCQARGKPPSWTEAKGSSCNAAFKGKTPPAPEEMLRYAEDFFLSEVNAYDIESRVEGLMEQELTLLCKPDDYSSRVTRDDKDAVEFLERARSYDYGSK